MISNASPLIFFGRLNKLDLLIKLFSRIEIIGSVYEEVVDEGAKGGKFEVEIIKEFIGKKLIVVEKLSSKFKEQSDFVKKSFRIERGESDTIAFVLQKKTKQVIIDEKPVRRAAEFFGILPIGTLGVILLAYKKNMINENEVDDIVEKLISDNFRIGSDVLNEFWKLLDEIKKKK